MIWRKYQREINKIDKANMIGKKIEKYKEIDISTMKKTDKKRDKKGLDQDQDLKKEKKSIGRMTNMIEIQIIENH